MGESISSEVLFFCVFLGGVYEAGICFGYQGARDKPRDSYGSTAYSFSLGEAAVGRS